MWNAIKMHVMSRDIKSCPSSSGCTTLWNAKVQVIIHTRRAHIALCNAQHTTLEVSELQFSCCCKARVRSSRTLESS